MKSRYVGLRQISPEARAARNAELAEFERLATERVVALERERAAAAEVARAAEARRRAEAERLDRVYAECESAWLAWLADDPDPDPRVWESPEGALASPVGAWIDPRELDRHSEVLRWVAKQSYNPAITAEMRELTAKHEPRYRPSHEQWGYFAIVTDTGHVVPPGLGGAKLRAWTASWRDSVAGLHEAELIVYAVPAKYPVVVTWWPDQITESAAHEWCRRLKPPSDDGAQRFQLISSNGGYGYSWPWRVPCKPIHLVSGHARQATGGSRSAAATRLLTGISSLDRLLSRGKPGLRPGSLTLIAGDQKQGKTLLAASVAHAAESAGYYIGWHAVDEGAADIERRRLQRIGVPLADLDDPPAAALAELAEQSWLVAGAERTVEELWEEAHGGADGAPLLIVLDSLQTVPSEAAADKSAHHAIEATIAVILQCLSKWPATVLATSEITRDSVPTGSRRIGYTFTARLTARRTGQRVQIAVSHNRHGEDGSFELAADFARQRLLEPREAEQAELRASIRTAVTGLGDAATGAAIEKRVGGDHNDTRAELRAMLASGELVQTGRGKATRYRHAR